MKEALNTDSYLALWAAGQFHWYLWLNFTDPVPQTAEELSKHKSLWTNNAWQKAHCLYEWRLMARGNASCRQGYEARLCAKESIGNCSRYSLQSNGVRSPYSWRISYLGYEIGGQMHSP